jgi:N utilization substance protein A
MKISEVVKAIKEISKEKNIKASIIAESIASGLVKAYRRGTNIEEESIIVDFDLKKETLNMFVEKDIVESKNDCEDEDLQITLEEALRLNPYATLGGKVNVPVNIDELGRMAALTAKQVIIQKLREEERNVVQDKYSKLIGQNIEVEVVGEKDLFYFVRVDNIDAILLKKEVNPNEKFKIGQKIKVYLAEIEKISKGLKLFMSRTSPKYLENILLDTIPEIRDGIVNIKGIARQAGIKAKVAVETTDENIDPVGSIIGQKASRVKSIVKEIAGDEIEVIVYEEDPLKYIENILKPAHIVEIFENEETREALVIVPDDQISLAIGIKGHNVKLAVKLSNWRIDIKTEEEAIELGLI